MSENCSSKFCKNFVFTFGVLFPNNNPQYRPPPPPMFCFVNYKPMTYLEKLYEFYKNLDSESFYFISN